MTGRTLGLLLTFALLVVPLTVEALPPGPRPRIGVLGGSVPAVNPEALDAFRQGLHELGWREGDTCVLEYRWPDTPPRSGDKSRQPAGASCCPVLAVMTRSAGEASSPPR